MGLWMMDTGTQDMSDRTLILRGELVERLERLAQSSGQSVEAALDDLLAKYAPIAATEPNWATTFAWLGEQASGAWKDAEDLSERSRDLFEQEVNDKLARPASADDDDAD